MTELAAPSTVTRLGQGRGAQVRLVCVPQAGGGSGTFRSLADALPAGVEACSLRLPGRESRRRERPLRSMDEVADALLADLDVMDDLPVALLGYCSGAFAAYEVARRLDEAGRGAHALVVLASPGPRVVAVERRVHDLPRPRLLDYLRSARITPDSVLADTGLFELFEPAIRADFATYETWDPRRARRVPPVSAPLLVVGAREDESVDLSDLLMWSGLTTADFTLRLLTGGHDFLSTAVDRVAAALGAALLGPCGAAR